MENLLYIIPRGIAIGILISAPMGPIGMLCIQRTLNKGRWPAFFTGIGAALSDIVYCLLTGLGISFITTFIENNQLELQILGGIVLIAFGVYLFKKNPTRALKPASELSNNFWGNFVTGFLFTFSNPLILFFIIGLFARFNIVNPAEPFLSIVGMASILLGATIWWMTLTLLVNLVSTKLFKEKGLSVLNKITGAVLIVLGFVGIISAVI